LKSLKINNMLKKSLLVFTALLLGVVAIGIYYTTKNPWIYVPAGLAAYAFNILPAILGLEKMYNDLFTK